MDAWAQVVVAALALGGPALAYLVAVRKTSGRIRASDASDLWEEARIIRQECTEEKRRLGAKVAELERMNLELMAKAYRLEREAAGDA